MVYYRFVGADGTRLNDVKDPPRPWTSFIPSKRTRSLSFAITIRSWRPDGGAQASGSAHSLYREHKRHLLILSPVLLPPELEKNRGSRLQLPIVKSFTGL